jgi:hypothetical protein
LYLIFQLSAGGQTVAIVKSTALAVYLSMLEKRGN